MGIFFGIAHSNMKVMLAIQNEDIKVPDKKLKKIIDDPVKSAEAANLIYINDNQPGIERTKKNNSFVYTFNGIVIKEEVTLRRIRSLVIPPAWTNVWICPFESGHLQATGIDSRKRKQYRYHKLWNSIRSQTKFYKMKEFGKALPKMRLQLEKDLSKKGFPQEKILATIISLMERSSIRIGNESYEKLYGSYGITTLRNHHAKINGNKLNFVFKGKKGIKQHISIYSKKLAKIVNQCKEIPGKELFQYIDSTGEIKTVDSGMVNQYIKEISEGDFTSKDFRTWAGTVLALEALKNLGRGETKNHAARNILSALDEVSKHLGNSRNVCRRYYVHPALITLYETNDLNDYFNELDRIEKDDNKAGLTIYEKILMKILNSVKP